MTPYYVRAKGCDESTEVIVDLADFEVTGLAKVAAALAATSNSNCMPTLEFRPATDQDRAYLQENE